MLNDCNLYKEICLGPETDSYHYQTKIRLHVKGCGIRRLFSAVVRMLVHLDTKIQQSLTKNCSLIVMYLIIIVAQTDR